MKKLYFLAVVLVMFAGCNKGETTPANPLVGKWKISQQLAVYYVNGAEVYRTTLPGVGANAYTEFKADGTLTDYALGTGIGGTGGVTTGGGTTTYVKNGQVYTANGQTVTISFIRL